MTNAVHIAIVGIDTTMPRSTIASSRHHKIASRRTTGSLSVPQSSPHTQEKTKVHVRFASTTVSNTSSEDESDISSFRSNTPPNRISDTDDRISDTDDIVYARQYPDGIIMAIAITPNEVYDIQKIDAKINEKPASLFVEPIQLNNLALQVDKIYFESMIKRVPRGFNHTLVGCVGYLRPHKHLWNFLQIVLLKLEEEEQKGLVEARKKKEYELEHEFMVPHSLYIRYFPDQSVETKKLFDKTGLARYMVRR